LIGGVSTRQVEEPVQAMGHAGNFQEPGFEAAQ
jgi:hypothetical protein